MGFKLRSKTNCGGVGEPPCPDPSEASKTRITHWAYHTQNSCNQKGDLKRDPLF
mgnify:CR=1 FL=1